MKRLPSIMPEFLYVGTTIPDLEIPMNLCQKLLKKENAGDLLRMYFIIQLLIAESESGKIRLNETAFRKIEKRFKIDFDYAVETFNELNDIENEDK